MKDPAARAVSQFYFLFFVSIGAFSPYLSLFLESAGFSRIAIGLLLGSMPLVSLFTQPTWGYIADCSGNRRLCLAICVLGASVTSFFYPLVVGHSFGAALVITLLFVLFQGAIIPLADSMALDVVERGGPSYGQLRVWGSVGFALFVPVFGYLLDLAGLALMFPLAAVALLCAALPVQRMPRGSEVHTRFSFEDVGGLVRGHEFVGFLISAFVLQVAWTASMNFFGIRMAELGASRSVLGISWTLAAVTEVPVFRWGRLWERRFGSRRILLLAFAFYALRTAIYASAGTVGMALVAQALHGLSFGAFYQAAVTHVGKLAPGHLRTVGQTLFWAVSLSLGAVAGGALGGVVADVVGLSGLYWVSTVCILFALLLLALLTRRRAQSDQRATINA